MPDGNASPATRPVQHRLPFVSFASFCSIAFSTYDTVIRPCQPVSYIGLLIYSWEYCRLPADAETLPAGCSKGVSSKGVRSISLVALLAVSWFRDQVERHCFWSNCHHRKASRVSHCGEVRPVLLQPQPCSPMNARFAATGDHRELPASGVRQHVGGEHTRNSIASLLRVQ